MGTRKFVGAGGGVFDITVPLTEVMRYQFDKGFIRLADGEAPFGELEDAPESEAGDKPKAADPKSVWVAHAQSQGMSHEDADAMTKAELVRKFG